MVYTLMICGVGLACPGAVGRIAFESPPVPEPPASPEIYRRERDNLRAHAEEIRRAAMTPRQRAFEDWSRVWYRSNQHKYEDKEAWLKAFEAASEEWNDMH